jgi:hypothetical protein
MPVKFRHVMLPLVAALMLGVATLACGQLGLPALDVPAWTPAPASGAPALQATAESVPAEVLAPTNTVILPTATSVTILPTVAVTTVAVTTMAPRPTFAPATAQAMVAQAAAVSPTQAPTVDPHHFVITEADITSSITGGGMAASGVQADKLGVHFTGDGKTSITADKIAYGPINLQNMAVVGRLVAKNGALQMDVESVAPQGFVSGMIPGVINQALQQYASQWYIESVNTTQGQIELQIR